MSTAKRSTAVTFTALAMAEHEPCFGATHDWYLGWPMKARHGPPHVGTMIWASRVALGARRLHKRDESRIEQDHEQHPPYALILPRGAASAGRVPLYR